MKAEILEAIIKFADHAHGDQKRKYTDERYIVHPIRVMQTCQQYSHDPAVLAAALLHDVLEDTPVTDDQIRNFLQTVLAPEDVQRTVSFVIELTDVFIKKDYPELKRNLRKEKEAERLGTASPEAQTIKYADIMDNAVNIVQHDPHFGYVYLKECKIILDKMQHGNHSLYERALHTIKEGMERVHKVDV